MHLRKLARLITHPRYWSALARRVAPSVEHCTALANLQPASVIDVGANKGQFAFLAGTLWPTANICCFEPLPGPRAKLARLMKGKVEIYDCALGRTEGAATIHIATREDSSSLLPLERQRELFGMEEASALEVPVRRLDDLISPDTDRPILLKIDVQGFEYEVLAGATKLLPYVDWIYVEASFVELYKGQKLAVEVAELLSSFGFGLSGEYNVTNIGGEPVQADMLFTAKQTGLDAMHLKDRS